MEEEVAGSLLKRSSFSQTIYHRSYSSSSLPFTPSLSIQPERTLDSRKSSKEILSPTENDSAAKMLESVSPHAKPDVSDTFREAKAQSKLKRSLTPHPRRKESEKGVMWKLLHRDSHSAHRPALPRWTPFRSPFRQSATVKLIDHKGREDSSWTKYFDHGGGKVSAVEAVDEHMVDLSELFLGLSFANGAHSKIYHGVYKDEAVAVKIITMPENDENKMLEARLKRQFNGEVALLCRLKHPNVITFVAAYSKTPVFCIVTEYLSEGSLRSYLHKSEHKGLPIKNLVAHALEIARGMEYIHSQGVIHRDLKPENILIDEDFHMKIADFGIACDEEDCDPFDDDPGTYRWMAPEMIKHKCYGRKVDVYSFGLILWEMVSGSTPYEDMNPLQAAYAVVNKKLRPPFPEDCPHVMQTLIEHCWLSQPEKRPEFWQIVQVLEQFESSIATDGSLQQVQNVTFQDHKKGLAHWIRKLTPSNSFSSTKPKFA